MAELKKVPCGGFYIGGGLMSGLDLETGTETNTLENKYAYLQFVNKASAEGLVYAYDSDSEIKSWDDLIKAIYTGKKLIINYNNAYNAVVQAFDGATLRANFVDFNYIDLLNKTPVKLYSFEISEEGIKQIAEGQIALEQ